MPVSDLLSLPAAVFLVSNLQTAFLNAQKPMMDLVTQDVFKPAVPRDIVNSSQSKTATPMHLVNLVIPIVISHTAMLKYEPASTFKTEHDSVVSSIEPQSIPLSQGPNRSFPLSPSRSSKSYSNLGCSKCLSQSSHSVIKRYKSGEMSQATQSSPCP